MIETTLERGAANVLTAFDGTNGRWLTRAQIARALGSGRLQAHHIYPLDYLTLTGKLEVRLANTKAPSRVRLEYRLVQQKGNAA